MDETPHLALPLLAHKQALQTTFHDEAIKTLDALVMLSVIDRDLSSPPASPSDGDRYIVKSPGAGDDAWTDDNVVVFLDGHWRALPPRLGWTCYVQDEGVLIAWDGSAWQPALEVLGGAALQNLALLGIGTLADAVNPVSAKLNNTLWAAKTVAEGGDGDLRFKLSKEGAANTLAFLFQNAFSGRAQIGLSGDDDFHIKVSPDGSSWLDALVLDRSTGKLAIQGFQDPAAVRDQIAASPFDALAYNGMQINGGIEVSQELGTAGATLSSGTEKYIADLVAAKYVHAAGTAVVTSAQLAASSFPGTPPAGYSFGHQLKATNALSSPANGDCAVHRFCIEGYRVARLCWGYAAAQPLSVGFQLYSTASGVAFVKHSNAAGNRHYYKEITVAAGWQWVSYTIPGDQSGTWEKTTGAGLIVSFFSAGKAASPVAPGAWTATDTTQTTNSGNLLAANNNQTIVTGLIVLPGIDLPSAERAPFIVRPFPAEEFECLRYYCKTFPRGINPAQNAGATGALYFPQLVSGAVNQGLTFSAFPRRMRVSPTSVTTFNPAANNAQARNTSAAADYSSTAAAAHESGVGFSATGPASGGAGQSSYLHYVADARF